MIGLTPTKSPTVCVAISCRSGTWHPPRWGMAGEPYATDSCCSARWFRCYFRELLSSHEEVHESIRPLLKLSRETIVRLQKTEYGLVSFLERSPLLADG